MTYVMHRSTSHDVVTIADATTLRPLFDAAAVYGATELDAKRTLSAGPWTGAYRIIQVVITGPDCECFFRDPEYYQDR